MQSWDCLEWGRAYLIARVCTCLTYVVTSLNWTLVLEQYLARFVVKNEDQKDKTCYHGILFRSARAPLTPALGAQIVDTILGSICTHRWKDLCVHLKSMGGSSL